MNLSEKPPLLLFKAATDSPGSGWVGQQKSHGIGYNRTQT